MIYNRQAVWHHLQFMHITGSVPSGIVIAAPPVVTGVGSGE